MPHLLKRTAQLAAVAGTATAAYAAYESRRLSDAIPIRGPEPYHRLPAIVANWRHPELIRPDAQFTPAQYAYARVRVGKRVENTEGGAIAAFTKVYEDVTGHAAPEVVVERGKGFVVGTWAIPPEAVAGAAKFGMTLPAGGVQEFAAVWVPETGELEISVGDNNYLTTEDEQKGKKVNALGQQGHNLLARWQLEQVKKRMEKEFGGQGQ